MNKKKFNVIKNISVVICILLFAIITYIELRGQYLEYAELGTQYVQTFWTNIKYKYSIMGITFILVSIMMLITNFGIKKGLKSFFDSERVHFDVSGDNIVLYANDDDLKQKLAKRLQAVLSKETEA